MPTLYIIAGPNGVGKTTFAESYLPGIIKQLDFVNPDLIARGLSRSILKPKPWKRGESVCSESAI
jgi:predicted ABC-type ATPase